MCSPPASFSVHDVTLSEDLLAVNWDTAMGNDAYRCYLDEWIMSEFTKINDRDGEPSSVSRRVFYLPRRPPFPYYLHYFSVIVCIISLWV